MAISQGQWHPYTDLASEAAGAVQGAARQQLPGVTVQEEQGDGFTVTRVHVHGPEGEQAIGKAPGRYVTIEAPGLRERNLDLQERISQALAREIEALLGLPADAPVLVVGLGNARATPDALGPRVVEKILVSRHLRDVVPAELRGDLRPVAALAPGVLGTTGVETGEVIQGVVERIRPRAVIAVDALAARSVERIGTAVQLADTGIRPGSGLQGRRVALDAESLGVPVIAIGVPTVVHAATIAYDTFQLLATRLKGRNAFFDLYAQFGPEEVRRLIDEVLTPAVGSLVVTPKGVDEMVEDMARLIAGALNAALHKGVTAKELMRYV
ncbi:GPR endopeptidase [Caldinitratiruptor microaerophilus]|uniref:Germination protease n=1 Tax=Caldinitratiruptor microaerophilus TaxID=671077 RepID=A0AA35CLI8_9FIRM|nr:GPR endopeptidase [Caldinitratiruptor microaerophilus]BDG60628.1 GPR endopeptidase [Caldinitratiruptor microaerophilus]